MSRREDDERIPFSMTPRALRSASMKELKSWHGRDVEREIARREKKAKKRRV